MASPEVCIAPSSTNKHQPVWMKLSDEYQLDLSMFVSQVYGMFSIRSSWQILSGKQEQWQQPIILGILWDNIGQKFKNIQLILVAGVLFPCMRCLFRVLSPLLWVAPLNIYMCLSLCICICIFLSSLYSIRIPYGFSKGLYCSSSLSIVLLSHFYPALPPHPKLTFPVSVFFFNPLSLCSSTLH